MQEGKPLSQPISAIPWFSLALIICYAIVFAAQVGTNLNRSIELAGEDKDIIKQGRELWRLLTGAALHLDFIHIAMNSYAFYSFGRDVELLTNRAHVPIIFLLSALGGSFLSLAVNPHGISIGASGGIIGLVGYLAVYSFRRREFISAQFRRSLLLNIGFILLYGLVLFQSVDNSGHVGGLITGAIYAFIQVPTDSYVNPGEASSGIKTAGLVSIGIYAGVCLFAVLVILQYL